MKIVHVAAHLGGGVGKAHAAIRAVDPAASAHTYILLEAPRDRRYRDAIVATGAEVIEAPDRDALKSLIDAADIVQIEFWNHPRLYEFLARGDLPPARYIFWSHISGLAPPLIAPGLAAAADAFVFTSSCSLTPGIAGNLHVVSSGFGLDPAPERRPSSGRVVGGYLGTVDFVKMHPDFFSTIDAVEGRDFDIRVYGAFDPHGAVADAQQAMRHPERVRLMGQTDDPASVLAEMDFFFYPLIRGHFGTAENALVEAMSAGLPPLVLDNPAECAIVRNDETGLIAPDLETLRSGLARLIDDAHLRQRLGDAAHNDATQRFRPSVSFKAFEALYAGLMAQPKHKADFASLLGTGPLDWYLGSFPKGSQAGRGAAASKGSLGHFLESFPQDLALKRYARAADEADGREE